MNRMQKKSRWMVVGIVICGAAVLAMLWNAGASRFWAPIGMMAAFIVGIRIALIVQDKLNKPCKEKSLQKKAWIDLGRCFIFGGMLLLFLLQKVELLEKVPKMMIPDDIGVRLVMLLLIIILGAWVAIGPYVLQKRILKGLDEREKLIYEKAKIISDSVFMGLSFTLCLGLPVWFGFKTPVPMYIPVCLFVMSAFIAEVVKPLIILIQCKLEQTEGDAV